MLDGVEALEFAAEIARLSTLSSMAYDQQRHGAAKRLNIRVTTLDAEVHQLQAARMNAPSATMSAETEEVIAEFNDKYLVVNEAGKAVIYAPAYDAVLKRERIERISFDDLRRLYLNHQVPAGLTENGEPIYKSAADVWLRSPKRRQYINGVTFDPSGRPQQDGVLNLWKGYAIKKSRGDWSLMRAHIHDVICDGDDGRFGYLMGWISRMFQNPGEQGEVAVVLKGGEGAGKGTLAKAILHIMGHHGLAISNGKHLTGNFNSHLRDCVFLFADEAFFAGDKASIGALKSLITEPYLTIEGKYQNAVQVPNFLHVLMASNEEWVVPAAKDARRFFVLDVPDTAKGCHDYFAEIWAQMHAGGYEAMLHDLLEYDLTGFNVRDVPVTSSLQEQRKLSLGTTDAWWMDVLIRGYVFHSRHGLSDHFGQWHDEMSMDLIYASYMEYAKERRERHPLSRETLGRQMRRFGAKPKRLTNGITGEHVTDVVTNQYGDTARKGTFITKPQPPGYRLGQLDSARGAFTGLTNLEVEWESEDEVG